MSGYPEIKLVDAPANTANVLFDFNLNGDTPRPPGRWVLRDSFNIGFPELVGEADSIDPLYGNRKIELTVRIGGTKASALAQQSAMARALLVGRGWLRVQLSAATDPVWFRTFRPEPGALSFDNAASDASQDLWDIQLTVEAEPFAYGERVTHSAQTVNNDPMAGTNPMRMTLAAIEGDAPTALRVAVVPTITTSFPSFLAMLHSGATVRTAVDLPVGTGDSVAAGGDTSAGTAGAGYVGGSYRQVNFAVTPGLSGRISASFGTVPVGDYRIFVRMTATAAISGQMQMSFDYAPSTALRSYSATTSAQWFEIGTVSLPGNRPLDPADFGPGVPASFIFSLSRTSGAGSLNIDHLRLVPKTLSDTVASTSMLVTQADTFSQAANSTRAVWDGDAERVWRASIATGALAPGSGTAGVIGTFIKAVPGAANVLTLFQSVTDGGIADVITRHVTVTVSHYPRWLYIGDS